MNAVDRLAKRYLEWRQKHSLSPEIKVLEFEVRKQLWFWGGGVVSFIAKDAIWWVIAMSWYANVAGEGARQEGAISALMTKEQGK